MALPAGATAADFDNVLLTVCRAGADPKDCAQVDCAPADVAACAITGLTPNSAYSVTAAGVKGRIVTRASDTVKFDAKYK